MVAEIIDTISGIPKHPPNSVTIDGYGGGDRSYNTNLACGGASVTLSVSPSYRRRWRPASSNKTRHIFGSSFVLRLCIYSKRYGRIIDR
jgi:hypothetical protein